MPLVAADVAWMLMATALVCAIGFVGVAWALFGYSLAFAPGNAAVGGLSYVFLDQAAVTPVAIPEMV